MAILVRTIIGSCCHRGEYVPNYKPKKRKEKRAVSMPPTTLFETFKKENEKGPSVCPRQQGKQKKEEDEIRKSYYTHIYIRMCVCVCVCVYIYIYIYIHGVAHRCVFMCMHAQGTQV